MIEFEALAIKAETNDMNMIFLLKKNIWTDIIKTILGYPPIAALDTLKEWKVVITSVGQGYESMESWHDYKMGTGTIFGGWGVSMDIGKSQDNFNKDGKPKCFNCNIYRYIAKEYRRPKRDKKKKEMLQMQQSKEIKHAHKYQDKKWKRIMITNIGRFRIHPYRDQ